MANVAKLEITGIKELQKSLLDVDRDLPKELAAGLAEASEIVAAGTRARMPRRTGRAAESVKVRKQQRGASLAIGGNKAEYTPWLDFGGRVGRNKSVVRPFLKEGRYVYPTLKDKRPEVEAKVDEVMKRLAERAGFDTKGDATRG